MNEYTIVIALEGSFAQTVKKAHNRAQAIEKALGQLWEAELDRVVSITITETKKREER